MFVQCAQPIPGEGSGRRVGNGTRRVCLETQENMESILVAVARMRKSRFTMAEAYLIQSRDHALPRREPKAHKLARRSGPPVRGRTVIPRASCLANSFDLQPTTSPNFLARTATTTIRHTPTSTMTKVNAAIASSRRKSRKAHFGAPSSVRRVNMSVSEDCASSMDGGSLYNRPRLARSSVRSTMSGGKLCSLIHP